jgi:hypothetical protein
MLLAIVHQSAYRVQSALAGPATFMASVWTEVKFCFVFATLLFFISCS